MNGRPLPKFLHDLEFTLDGKTLQMFSEPTQPGFQYFALESQSHSSTGLFVDFERGVGEARCSQALTRYVGGYETTYTAWDEGDCPEDYPAGSFEEWVRAHLKKDIERLLSWHLEGIMRQYPVKAHVDVYQRLCADYAGVPAQVYRQYSERRPLFEMLSTVHEVGQRGVVSAEHEDVFAAFLKSQSSATHGYTRQLNEYGYSIALTLLPVMPKVLKADFLSQVDAQFASSESAPEGITPEDMMRLARRHAESAECIRVVAEPRLMALCTDPNRAHIVFSNLQSLPAEARWFLEHGLSLKPENISLLIAAESFFIEHSEPTRLKAIQERIQALGVAPSSSDNVQDWIDRYTYLSNDFRCFQPRTDSEQTGPELVELEARLNRYWLSRLPGGKAPTCPSIEHELMSQKRFLSAGSAGYVGWLRSGAAMTRWWST